jgi:Dyp-type peroxidase family
LGDILNSSISTREAPVSSPLRAAQEDPTHPDVAKSAFPEPRLAVHEIQGNIIPGFLKDFETLLFLRIEDADLCKLWLSHIHPLIATAEEVLAFNRLFKALRFRRGHETKAIKATWINIAFSYRALRSLTSGTALDLRRKDFLDTSFRSGMARQSSALGDPTDSDAEGHPDNWVIGGPLNEADILLIIQSDDRDDLLDQVQQIEESIYTFRHQGTRFPGGVRILYKEYGATLPGAQAGHEHFGFLDGISQPGIRGYVSDDSTDLLTPRQNPGNPHQGKPGQDLLWPGEFVFGYPGQDVQKPVEEPGQIVRAGPDWAANGSFLVFRRLRQDVGAFHSFLYETGKRLQRSPEFIGAKIVGRWPGGAPLSRTGQEDDAALGYNDCANNDFQYFNASAEQESSTSDEQCARPDRFPLSPADPTGLRCPAFAHIRRAYPRDDITPEGRGDSEAQKSASSRSDTQTHRLLRRGLPFGPPSRSTPDAPFLDSAERGLLFIAYQTSIERQFEFIMQRWLNDPDFKQKGAGFDLLIGQNSNRSRERTAPLVLDDPAQPVTLTATQEWVVPTGGGYFFAPSLSAIEKIFKS